MARHDAPVLTPTARAEVLAGAKAVAPMLVGVIPFGLVAGATPATTGLGGGTSIGLSTIVFAGASQLAAADATRKAQNMGVSQIDIVIRGTGSGREQAIRSLQSAGLEVSAITDVTPIPHNGCRPPKRRRV